MLSRWPIRYKLTFGFAVLFLIMVSLAFSSFSGVYAYREPHRQADAQVRQ